MLAKTLFRRIVCEDYIKRRKVCGTLLKYATETKSPVGMSKKEQTTTVNGLLRRISKRLKSVGAETRQCLFGEDTNATHKVHFLLPMHSIV